MAVSGTAPPNAERMGITAADLEFSSWGWAFRSQEVEDYGIDAHVEPFGGPSSPTGQLLALQIKSGESYFAGEADGGWWYRGKNRHLRYWLGHVLPVLIVLYDPAAKTLYWQHVTEDAGRVHRRGMEDPHPARSGLTRTLDAVCRLQVR